jgi:peroxiredoxin-like protein
MHIYEVNIKWTGSRKGTLSSPDLSQEIEVAAPPDFLSGIEGLWSPEHLLVASINSCLMTTFLSIAENSNLEFQSFESQATCKIEKLGGKYHLTQILLKPKLVIASSQNLDKAMKILEISEKACLVSSAIKINVRLQPEIIVV